MPRHDPKGTGHHARLRLDPQSRRSLFSPSSNSSTSSSTTSSSGGSPRRCGKCGYGLKDVRHIKKCSPSVSSDEVSSKDLKSVGSWGTCEDLPWEEAGGQSQADDMDYQTAEEIAREQEMWKIRLRDERAKKKTVAGGRGCCGSNEIGGEGGCIIA